MPYFLLLSNWKMETGVDMPPRRDDTNTQAATTFWSPEQ